ncbi:MAG TPA: hypothetical protein VLE53_07605 [Gemmatimonadaceae bacterium]|nr:hypothetical protein [Gemmatimonadaceae bacterium]
MTEGPPAEPRAGSRPEPAEPRSQRFPPGRLVLIGHPVAHSLSPVFQNAALRRAGLPLVYEALDVVPEALDATLEQLARERAAGNVTLPHKLAVASACRHLTPEATRAGAVNTFWHEGGALVGDNTDVAGFDAMARALLGGIPAGVTVFVLGSGGGAAAVCAAVSAWPGARLRLHARNERATRALAARFPGIDPSGVDAARTAAIVVNATPVGLTGDALPIPVGYLARDAVVMDLAYRAGETAWVRAARAAGHRAADGREMLLAQGACAFERWFGFAPDLGVMRAALAGVAT